MQAQNNYCVPLMSAHTKLEHNITNIILVDASESLNGSRVEAYAKGNIR